MGNRVVAAAVVCALLTPSVYAARSASTPPSTASADNDASQCSALDVKWKIAEASCSTNANLGRARSLARDAQGKCKSSDAAQRKLGAGKYESALRLCRKGGGDH
jgi:hypothetical protein